MLARSVRNPLVIGLGTGVILIIGAAPPVLAAGDTTSPSPSQSATSPGTTDSSSPAPPALFVTLNRTTKGAIHEGNTVSFVAHVTSGTTAVDNVELALGVDQHASVDADCVMDVNACVVGPVTKTGKDVDFTVSINSKMSSGTVHLNAKAFSTVDNKYVEGLAKPYSINVTKAPTPKSSKSPSPKSSHSSGSGSGGSSGSTGSTNNNTTRLGNVSGTNNLAPSVAPQNNAVLPGIGQQNPGQTPSTAPLVETAGNSQSMSGTADGPDELTFDKLASTQAAWLAALLVAFSLLLTQVRLGKANARAAKPAKPKGAHRRTRRRQPGSRAL